MFYFLSKTADVLLSPLAWGVALIAAALFLKRKRLARILAAGGLLCWLVFSTPVVANALWSWVEVDRPLPLPPGDRYDAVILLGGMVSHRPTMSSGTTCFNDAAERLIATYDLLRTDRVREAILTGGIGFEGDTVNEAETLKKQLMEWGIPESRLVLEPNARNTRENATETARIARKRKYEKLLLVTSAFHMERSMAAFRRAGLDPVPFPVDYRSFDTARISPDWLPRAEHLAQSEKALRELFGRLAYRIVDYG